MVSITRIVRLLMHPCLFFPLVQTTVHQDFLLHKEFARSSGTCNSTVMEGMIQRVEILKSRFNISSSAGTFVLSEIYDDT